MTAVKVVIGGDAIADRETCNSGAHRDDFTCDFVTEDARKLRLSPPGLYVLNCQPRSAGDDARHSFARPSHRLGQLDNFEREIRAPQHHRLHAKYLRPLGPRRISSPAEPIGRITMWSQWRTPSGCLIVLSPTTASDTSRISIDNLGVHNSIGGQQPANTIIS